MTISGLLTGLIISGELLVLLTAALGFILLRSWRGRQCDRELARALIDKLKAGEAARSSRLKTVLRDNFHLDDEAAGMQAEALIAQETALYGGVLRVVLGPDRDALTTLDEKVEELSKACRELGSDRAPDLAPGPMSEEVRGLNEEFATLRQAKQDLDKELAHAKAVTEHVLAEYASMYEGGRDEGMKRITAGLDRLQKHKSGAQG